MRSRTKFFLAASLAAALHALPLSAEAQTVQRTYANNPGAPNNYNSNELVESGHQFFGSASRGLALAVQDAVSRWGEPNGYILGQEASGAFFGGLRYGEGKLFTRNAGERRIFWQGPSLGFDVGGDGARTMMLVYNLQNMDAIYRRFVGINGSAYLIGGFGVSAAKADEMVVVPIRTGVGARLGVNMGYLKFTTEPTWNPF
ncbi:DUF1134 domain-containing protein [Microvirga flavescens]|uniref:DUF1134 domain-containing protein n=1 Tax=Microvirga flavescens TaxID=2249811 RepID=UPI000DD7C95B|nr:DUF1134 domain-containing protein [Microvirga flavescens]